jgi:serine/threonine-protein kinase
MRLLESLERRALAGHYELLDVRPDIGVPEVRERARGLTRQVEDMRVKLPPQAQGARVEALLNRIEAAAGVLGTPSERLTHDARKGNFQGVARCVVAGVPAALVESRRRAYLKEFPGKEPEAQRRLARSNVALKMGNLEVALAELDAALRADPLNLGLHQLRGGLERKLTAQPAPGK